MNSVLVPGKNELKLIILVGVEYGDVGINGKQGTQSIGYTTFGWSPIIRAVWWYSGPALNRVLAQRCWTLKLFHDCSSTWIGMAFGSVGDIGLRWGIVDGGAYPRLCGSL